MSVLYYVTIVLILVGIMMSGFSIKAWIIYEKPILSVSITVIYFIVVFIVMGTIYFFKIKY